MVAGEGLGIREVGSHRRTGGTSPARAGSGLVRMRLSQSCHTDSALWRGKRLGAEFAGGPLDLPAGNASSDSGLRSGCRGEP